MKLSLGTSSSAPRSLQKRKGGGGKGGGGGGGAKGGGGGGAKGGGGGFTGRSNSTPLKSSGIGSSGTVYGGGGGARRTVDSGAPFAGREYGGGTRDSTFGTSRYGSGYPYGGVGGTFVSARPFPFGYWPLFWGVGAGGYYGHSVYGPHDNSSRPGGTLQTAVIRNTGWPNTTSTITSISLAANFTNTTAPFYITGDLASVQAVLDALVTNCSVVNSTITPFDPPSTAPHPEQVLQYYRASSFSLASEIYNDTANLPANAPANNDTNAEPLSADTPLPNGIDLVFLSCINQTIGAAVPIADSSAFAIQANLMLISLVWLIVSFSKVF